MTVTHPNNLYVFNERYAVWRNRAAQATGFADAEVSILDYNIETDRYLIEVTASRVIIWESLCANKLDNISCADRIGRQLGRRLRARVT